MLWAAQVKAVLDEAAALRTYAAILAPHNLKEALKLLRQADQRELTPMGESAQKVDDAAAVAEWEAAHGKWDDPETQAKVYRAIEEMRRRELEEQGKISAQRAVVTHRQTQRRTPGKTPRATAKPEPGRNS